MNHFLSCSMTLVILLILSEEGTLMDGDFTWERGQPIYDDLMDTINRHRIAGGNYSHADFLGATARVIASIVRTIEHQHPENETVKEDAKRLISEVIDDQSMVAV